MLAALAVVIPLGLGGAISPVMLTEQTVLLAGPAGVRAGVRYALGVVCTTLSFVVAIVLFGHAISLPTEPHLDATLDIVLGVVLIIVAGLVHISGRRRAGHRVPRMSRSTVPADRARVGLRWRSACSPWRRM